jgi:hypothetical protein
MCSHWKEVFHRKEVFHWKDVFHRKDVFPLVWKEVLPLEGGVPTAMWEWLQ